MILASLSKGTKAAMSNYSSAALSDSKTDTAAGIVCQAFREFSMKV